MQKENTIKLMTETELADQLHVSIKLLQKMRREGTGPKYLKIGRLVRYHEKDINEYLMAVTLEYTRQEA